MPIHATIERLQPRRNSRDSARLRLRLEASGRTTGKQSTSVLIHNLSSSGLLMETEASFAPGDKVIVALPEAGDVAAAVVWQSEKLFGCRFEEPLSRAALGAAQLRNPLPPKLDLAEPADTAHAHETLGQRLLRLRRARGLSRSGLATQMGMSKPSLWAWETGKTIPRRKSLIALAKALSVSDRDLLGETEDSSATDVLHGTHSTQRLQSLIDRKKKEIAAFAGVKADKVKISIEF